MNYIVYYTKDGFYSIFYAVCLQQIVTFFNLFGKDLDTLCVMLYNKQDNHVTLVEHNKLLVCDNLTPTDLMLLLRYDYQLDDYYYLP